MVEESATVSPRLSQLYVYLTNGCNCSCEHCWIVSRPDSGRKVVFLPLDVFEAAIDEAKPLGLSEIKWTGGEPTIHPQFPDLLDVQRKHGLVGRLETNGMAITPSLAKQLFESGVKHVSVSLDGSISSTHDQIRGVPGAYERTIAGFRRLVEAGFIPQIIMSLMRDNLKELPGLLELARGMGASSVKINLVQPMLRGQEIHKKGGALSVREVLDLRDRLEKEIRPACSVPIMLDIPAAFQPLRTLIEQSGCSVCGIKSILGLLADGSYALCGIGENVPDLVFGTAGKGMLREIWEHHPILEMIRDGIPRLLKGICRSCLMKSVCLGSCVAHNYYRNGDILAGFWFCEEAAAEGYFPQTRLIPA